MSNRRSPSRRRPAKLVRFAFLALVAGAVALLAGAGTAHANFKGNNGLIAFDSWTGTSQDIGVFDPAGSSAPTMLSTTADFSESAPRWSPDGSKIVYMGYPQHEPDFDRRDLTDIWVMDANGEHKTQVTNTTRREEVPAWTADGRIVFCGQAANDPNNWDIYLINADGTGLKNLTKTSADTFECWPSPAPSGNKLAFTRATETEGPDIWTMKLDGTGLRKVSSGLASDWSPLGNDIVFLRDNDSGTDVDVWMTHADGSGPTQLTNTPNLRESFPSWSPDGSKVVYPALVQSGVFNIFSTDVATGETHLLLADAPPTTYSVAYPSWQPLARP